MSNVLTSFIYNTQLILSLNNKTIINYDGTGWSVPWGDNGEGVQPYFEFNDNINAILEFNSNLYFAGDNGIFYEWDTITWTNKSSEQSSDIYSGIVFDNTLVFGASFGQIFSWDGTNWKYGDGSGNGTGLYNSGTVVGDTKIVEIKEIEGELVFYGENGNIGYYDSTLNIFMPYTSLIKYCKVGSEDIKTISER